MYYIHKDYLGSFQSITDEDGELVEKYSFDPWGRRRNAQDWSFSNVPENFIFDCGYTGHQHLHEFGLINMNGRVYDPFVARFLSPDPFVQNPNGRQGLNRYSYASNNPLIYIDPTGYFMAPADAINLLWNSEYGGSWSNGEISYFNSNDQAFEAGVNYQNLHGSWGNTEHGSEQASRDVYSFISNSSSYKPNTVLGILAGKHYVNYNYSTHKFYYVGTTKEIDIKRLLNGQREVEQASGGDNSGLTLNEATTGVSAMSLSNSVKGNLVEWGMEGANWGKTGARYMKVVRGAGIAGTVFGMGVSTYNIVSDVQAGNAVNSWDVADLSVGAAGLGATIFLASNPVGWAIAGGATIYFGARFVYDISTKP
jgi:RHS repeat-associated protein